ncbi:Similar to S.cerevisiae protein PFA3 (Palmitoyltransferase for Vac8p) [Malassezia sympodialis ATCC 42132]|uniref:Palmitoyltransferase n=1 Tax=Malassezia sympodialis (strain ATCC 42132) TaxID=1230383 RepID=A0A1M8A503_MALS4|nr:Similar to S.cerevisiae protein PFA3 (Palmitoyltransferase for Vac8p) [Malassezia sympodialis ATCC 42132]
MQGRIAAALGLSGMALWCLTAVVTRPSYHDSREPLPGTITIKRSNGRPRWCSKCSAPKPDRCHHCRQCGRCVLKMDHHCPWLLDTCIGLRNYKAFVLFLLYTSLFCVLCLDTLVRACLALWSDDPEVVVEIPLLWIALFALTLLLSLTLIPFFLYHVYLISANMTTLENMEGLSDVRLQDTPAPSSSHSQLSRLLVRPEERPKARDSKINVYNVGLRGNWAAVFGPQWRWCWAPCGKLSSEGYTFPVNQTALRAMWEQRDYSDSGDARNEGPTG